MYLCFSPPCKLQCCCCGGGNACHHSCLPWVSARPPIFHCRNAVASSSPPVHKLETQKGLGLRGPAFKCVPMSRGCALGPPIGPHPCVRVAQQDGPLRSLLSRLNHCHYRTMHWTMSVCSMTCPVLYFLPDCCFPSVAGAPSLRAPAGHVAMPCRAAVARAAPFLSSFCCCGGGGPACAPRC